MLRNLIFFLPFLVLFSCSSGDDGTTEVQEEEMEDEEDMLQTYSFGMDISPDYFADNETARVYISNVAGVIVFQAELVNGSTNDFSFDAPSDQVFDCTIYRRVAIDPDLKVYTIRTFEGFVFGDYSMDRVDPSNVLHPVELEFTNFGSINPMVDGIFYSPTTGSYNSNNGGVAMANEQAGGGTDFYLAGWNSTDATPRYYFQESINAPVSLTQDFNNLPFADDVLSVSFPANNNARAFVVGFNNYSSNSFGNLLRFETSDTDINAMNIFLKDGVFDLYQVLFSYSLGNRNYRHEELNTALNYTLSNPDFDFTVQNNSISDFSATTTGSYETYGAQYRLTDDTTFNLSYNIVGRSSETVGFSKDALFDAIFSDVLIINSASLEPASFGIETNNTTANFAEDIQYILNISLNQDALGHRAQGVSESFE